jgi:hypothetical protein
MESTETNNDNTVPMHNPIFGIRSKETYITLSGIEVEIQSLVGKWQKELTQSNEQKRRGAFDEMLFDCINRIGSKTKSELTMKDIRALFREDRKQALFNIRQISNKNNPLFTFNYEFPTKNGKKYKQKYTVKYEKEDFPVKPYQWVREEMFERYRKLNEIEEGAELDEIQQAEALDTPIPILFQDYQEIVNKFRKQEFVLPESKVLIEWEIMDGEKEKQNQGVLNADNVSSHTQIMIRNCIYRDEKKTPIKIPLDRMDTLDIEALRYQMMEVEGDIETSVVVQYKEDTTMQANVDLVTTAGFFFPSLAI